MTEQTTNANEGSALDDLTIRIVQDNYSCSDRLETAWGFAAYLTGPQERILFDTGSDRAEVVIAAGVGHKAIGWFERLGIEVATGSRGNVGATLQAYLAGEMQGASGCAHGHGGSPGSGAEESLRE